MCEYFVALNRADHADYAADRGEKAEKIENEPYDSSGKSEKKRSDSAGKDIFLRLVDYLRREGKLILIHIVYSSFRFTLLRQLV